MKDGANILRILKETKRLIESENSSGLKKLSDQTIHSATISQDADNVIVTVLVYSLGKIFEREHYRKMEGWDEFYNSLIENLKNAISCLENENPKECRLYLGRMRQNVKICSKVGTKMVVCSYANNLKEMRGAKDLLAFARLIGMSGDESKNALNWKPNEKKVRVV